MIACLLMSVAPRNRARGGNARRRGDSGERVARPRNGRYKQKLSRGPRADTDFNPAVGDWATRFQRSAPSYNKTLAEVERYTKGANQKLLAASGMAKRRGQNVNAAVTNAGAAMIQTPAKSLK